ncbi:hypothetical protein [Armatimonas sp.]|uniref:hypothetical protein n=1 Tax=Armatimonas sp. TaxID=1872638 RepID=UPI003750702E
MTDIETVATFCQEHLNLGSIVRLGDEYAYPHLPLCFLDAVWSIGVRYQGVQGVVKRYEKWAGLGQPSSVHTTAEFLEKLSSYSAEQASVTIFANRQRTSTRGGILKAEAVVRFARVLDELGIQTFEDLVQQDDKLPLVETKIRQIPGQTSGLSWRYFLMLAGASHLTKPDRQVLCFFKTATSKNFSTESAQALLVAVCEQLRSQCPLISPRELDHLIWQYQRTR